MTSAKNERTVRLGLLVSGALVVMMLFLFFIGSERKIFARKNEYEVRLDSVSGLADGNPVRISGVTVGVVKDILLPPDPKQKDVQISLMVDRKYSERIRTDSRARLKKLGLLAGDSYIDITPGTPKMDVLEPGAIIPAQRQTNVDQLISSGEDLVDNFVQISYSLKNVLARVDRGEGLLGEVTSNSATKQRLTDTLMATLNKTNSILAHVESGKGLVGKLVYDDKYAEQLAGSLSSAAQSLNAVASTVQHSFDANTGMLPTLLNDPHGKKQVLELIENLKTTSANLSTFSSTLQTGQGLVPRLLNDKPYGDQALNEFSQLIAQLNGTVKKINSGEGTAGKLISDPSVYESINDILIGINESKFLRWIIRNRQEKGIEKRYQQEQPVPGKASPETVPPEPSSPKTGAPPKARRGDRPAPTPSHPPATQPLPPPATSTGETVPDAAPATTTQPPLVNR